MSNLFKSKAKLLYMGYALIFALVIVLSLYYMTNYSDIHVYFAFPGKVLEINAGTEFTVGGKTYTNAILADFIKNHGTEFGYSVFEGDFASFIYDFQIKINEFNDLILVYGLVGFVVYALLLLFANHSRNVYYISNLVVGLVLPTIMLVFSVVMIIQNLGIMAEFSDNEKLFKIVSLIQNTDITAQVKDSVVLTKGETYQVNLNKLLPKVDNVNTLTFIIATIVFALVAVYQVLVIAYTVIKYKGSAKRRNEIIERAAKNND